MPDLGQSEPRRTCAVNCCPRTPSVRLRLGNVVLAVCQRHERTYRSLNYEVVGAESEHTPRGRSES
jgi:hypothetical protein